MEVKKGYKQTDIGVIPTDWEVKRLGELGKFSKGQGIRKDEAQSGDIPCIRYGEIYTKHDNVIKEYYSFISPSVAKTAKKIKQGDILFAGSGETKEEIGKCAANIISKEVYAGGDVVILSPLNADSLLLGYLLNSPPIVNQKSSKGQGDAVVHISAKALKEVAIPLPKTKSEQSAIATVLSETDSLITKLEKLIAKKEAVKKGTMQALLTGKKRLSGFNKERFKVELKDIVNIFKGSGLSKSKVSEAGTFKCILYGELFTKYGQVIRKVVGYTDYTEGIVSKNGDILLPGSTTTIGIDLAIASAICENNVLLGGDINILRRKSECYNSEFLVYYLTHIKRNEIAERTQGTTIIHLYGKSLANIQLDLPMLEEQEAIAKVIEDMEAEVFHLQEKLQKYKMIKQSMMQNLLTGKIRLV